MFKNDLNFELPIGLWEKDSSPIKDVCLLTSNGISEKVYATKLSEKPYTYLGNIISVSVKSIGSTHIGIDARKDYMDSGSVTIPNPVRKLTLADANTLSVEIHRRVWQEVVKDQEVPCKFCAKSMICDVNLAKITLSEKQLLKLEAVEAKDSPEIVVVLGEHDGFTYTSPKLPKSGEVVHPEYDKKVFNRFVFKFPLLEDAIRHERYIEDNIVFWRRIAFDCLISVQKVSAKGEIELDLPMEIMKNEGIRVFDQKFSSDALRSIRTALRSELPTMHFYYEDDCACESKRIVPIVLEPSGFFSV